MAEPFAETLEPRGEGGLVGWWFYTTAFFARVVGHAFDPRQFRRDRGSSATPKPGGTYALGLGESRIAPRRVRH